MIRTTYRSRTSRIPWRDWSVDVSLALLTVAAGFLPFTEPISDHRVLTILGLTVLAVAVLLIRRGHPLILLIISGAGYIVASVLHFVTPAYVVPVALALYSLALVTERRKTVPIATATAVLIPATSLVVAQGSILDSRVVQLIAIIAFAAAIGDAQRSRRAYLAELRDRAERAERERESEAQRRLVEERLRIARDLHDVVAHQIAVINLHAGVASAALGTSDEEAARALAVVRDAGRTVLREIGDLLATLRDAGPEDELVPLRGIAQLPELISRFNVIPPSGIELVRPGDVPAAVDIVAYRVVQEGLVNAHKHGARGRTEVELVRESGTLRIRIENRVRPLTKGAGSGYGLIGIRERVESVRGKTEWGRTEYGTFLLSVTLPLRQGDDYT